MAPAEPVITHSLRSQDSAMALPPVPSLPSVVRDLGCRSRLFNEKAWLHATPESLTPSAPLPRAAI